MQYIFLGGDIYIYIYIYNIAVILVLFILERMEWMERSIHYPT